MAKRKIYRYKQFMHVLKEYLVIKVVYIGITNNPERREREHCLDGKKFSHMKVVSIRRMTKAGAKKEKRKGWRDIEKTKGKSHI